MLEKAASMAETRGEGAVSPDYVRMAGASVHTDITEQKLTDLDLDRRVVLLSIARSLFKTDEVTITHAEKTYAAACEEYGIPAKKHTQFYTYVKYLESIGAIRTEVRRDPEGGRTTFIRIPGYPPRALAEELEAMMENGGGGQDEVRFLQRRCRDLPRVQRGAPMPGALQLPRGASRQEGDPQAG